MYWHSLGGSGAGGSNILLKLQQKQITNEGNVLFKKTQHILLMVIWYQTYGYGNGSEDMLQSLCGLLVLNNSKGSFTCTSSCGVMAGKRNRLKGPPRRIDLMTHHTELCPVPQGMERLHSTECVPWTVFLSISTYPTICCVFCIKFVFCYLQLTFCYGRKKGNVPFNNMLNTFYLLLFCITHMVKDHSDCKRRNLLPSLHGLLFLISSKVSFTCTITQTE